MARISKRIKKASHPAAGGALKVQKGLSFLDKTRRVMRKAVVSPVLSTLKRRNEVKKGRSQKKSAPKTFARIDKKMTFGQARYLTTSHPAVGGAIAKATRIQKKMTFGQVQYFTPAGEPRRPEAAATGEMQGYRIEMAELPKEYGKDMIVLQVRDPWWLHAYWEVREGTLQKLKHELLALFNTAKKALRVYDVSFIDFNGSNAHRYFDIELTRDCLNYYIDTGAPGRSWCVDLGLKLSDGRFITIVRSNTVTTPLDGPSWISDEEWMVPYELFAKLYATAVGLGGSPVKIKKPWLELQKRRFASGGISSIGISPVRKKEELKRKFWLAVNTELILYGATEPDAKVTVAGSPISLRTDGTFSLRFALPDGKQVIPVHAKSSDGIDQRTITPVVIKETK